MVSYSIIVKSLFCVWWYELISVKFALYPAILSTFIQAHYFNAQIMRTKINIQSSVTTFRFQFESTHNQNMTYIISVVILKTDHCNHNASLLKLFTSVCNTAAYHSQCCFINFIMIWKCSQYAQNAFQFTFNLLH